MKTNQRHRMGWKVGLIPNHTYQLKDYVPSQQALGDLGIGALGRWGIGAMGQKLKPQRSLAPTSRRQHRLLESLLSQSLTLKLIRMV